MDPIVAEKLKPYWGFDNPRLEEYAGLRCDGKHLVSVYSDRLAENCHQPDVFKELERAMVGGVIYDFGCGMGHSLMRVVGFRRKTRAMIGVDLEGRESYQRLEPVDLIRCRSDMLQFLAQIHSNSGSFIFNGIDFLGGDYLNAFIYELERATKKGGVVFGVGSEPIEHALRESDAFVDFDPYGKQQQLIEMWAEGEGDEERPKSLSWDFFLFTKEGGE